MQTQTQARIHSDAHVAKTLANVTENIRCLVLVEREGAALHANAFSPVRTHFGA